MSLSRDKDDDDEFIPNPNYQSNLAAIFGNSVSDGNPSLVYTAPKQPKPPKTGSKPVSSVAPTSSSAASPTRVIIAKRVQAFRMVDGAYQNNGSVTAALYMCAGGAGEPPVYQILLNKDRRNYLCNMRVVREFNYHVQPKNYVTFYTGKVVWSILFGSPAEVVEFSLQVALARWRSGDATSAMVHQDLWCPDNDRPAAAVRDTVEIVYHLLSLDNCSQDCEEGGGQRVSVEVESTGWTQALIDARPTNKRVLFLQPFMLGDLNPTEAGYVSPVVVRLTVLQVNKAPPDIPDHTVMDDLISLPKLPPLTVGSSSSPKTDLISRMARLGQPLPKTVGSIPSDSDETEEDLSGRLQRSGRTMARLRTRGPSTVSVVTPPPPVSTPVTQQVSVQWAPTPFMGGASGMFGGGGGENAAQFNMFLSEVRTTNSELRMGVTRLTDKVEALQNKLENPEKKSGEKDIVSVMERLLESVKSVLSNLQVNSSPSQAASIPTSCQRCADLGTATDSLTEKIRNLQEENDLLKTSLSAQTEALQNAKMADRDQMSQISSLRVEVETGKSTIIELNEKIVKYQREEEAARKTIQELQTTVGEQQRQVDRLEQSLRDSEEVKVGQVRELMDTGPVVIDHVKNIYNIVSRLIKSQFIPGNMYDVKYIKSVFSETVRGVALEYLERGCTMTPSDMEIFTKLSASQDGSEEKVNVSTAVDTKLESPGVSTSASATADTHNGETIDEPKEATSSEGEEATKKQLDAGAESDESATGIDNIQSEKLQTLLFHIQSRDPFQSSLCHGFSLQSPPPPLPPPLSFNFFHHNK